MYTAVPNLEEDGRKGWVWGPSLHPPTQGKWTQSELSATVAHKMPTAAIKRPDRRGQAGRLPSSSLFHHKGGGGGRGEGTSGVGGWGETLLVCTRCMHNGLFVGGHAWVQCGSGEWHRFGGCNMVCIVHVCQ